jgi:hypothetical protein
MRHREVPETAVNVAQLERSNNGKPVIIALHEAGHFKKDELKELMRFFGKEVLFDFMRESEPYSFFYRRLDKLPEFADKHDLRLGVTSVLLEGSKKTDDWRQMQRVFPDHEQPIEPKADMYKRMGDIALGVLELKLLTAINGELTPRGAVQLLGLPMHDIYQMLLRLARLGILAPQVDEVIEDVSESVEDSVQQAFAALDANDDQAVRKNALDKVLGGGEELAKVQGHTIDQELLTILRKNKHG